MIYLNNAATSYPKAPDVPAVVKEALCAPPGSGNRANSGRLSQRTDCRTLLAGLLGVSSRNRIVYACNATHALNMALLGFPWKKGDMVLTTASEHNAVLRPLHLLQSLGVIQYHIVSVERDGHVSLAAWKEALRQHKPRLAAFTHASNVTGAVNDCAALTQAAKNVGAAVLLDASQSLGVIPVLPQKWDVDMAAFTGHKYLLGPQGTGGLYVREGLELRPILTGGTGIHSDEDEMPREMPLHLEAGTGNEPSFLGLQSALEWSSAYPLDPNRLNANVMALEQGLLRMGLQVVQVEGERTPVLAFTGGPLSPEDWGDVLVGGYDIVCRTGLHCAPRILPALGFPAAGSVRLSLSRFTTEKEIGAVLSAFEEILSDG